MTHDTSKGIAACHKLWQRWWEKKVISLAYNVDSLRAVINIAFHKMISVMYSSETTSFSTRTGLIGECWIVNYFLLFLKIRSLLTAMEMSIRSVDTFVHGEVRVTIRYLSYELFFFQRNSTQHCSWRTGYHKICEFFSNGNHAAWRRTQSWFWNCTFKSVTA